MNKLASACIATVLMTSPAAASDQASIRLVAYVPVQCSLDILGASIQQHQLVVDVRRTCNTSHELTLLGQSNAALGALNVSMNGNQIGSSASAAFYQPEEYYDQVDRIVIQAPNGSEEDLAEFASTLQVSISPA